MDQKTQDKLDKLEKMVDKLEKMENASKNRTKKYLDKAKASGKKQISALISASAFNEICRRRDQSILVGKPITTGQIIEQALFPSKNGKAEPVYNNIFDAPMNEKS